MAVSALKFSKQMFFHANKMGSMAQLLTRQCPCLALGNPSFLHTAAILEAARKGTRAKREAKKRASKKEVVKKEYIPLKKRQELLLSGGSSPRRIEDHLKVATDDVYFRKYYRRKIYSLKEVLTMFREAHHETLLDSPNSLVNAYMEFNFDLDKKNRYMDAFTDVVKLPHHFDIDQQRDLLVISQSQEVLDYARQVGVTLALGMEVVKMAQKDEINLNEFKYIISDLSLLPELVTIRGLMKRSFPSPRNGTAGNDLIPMIDRFMKGIEYKTIKNKYHQDFAHVEIPVGRLSMTNEELEENVTTLLRDIEAKNPKQRKSKDLISLVVIRSPPSKEHFKINHFDLLRDESVAEVAESVAQ